MQRPQGWASRPLGSMCKVTLSQPWVPILSPLSPWQKSQPPSPVLGEPPASQVPRPPRPGLPHSPPGPTYHPPALGSHGHPAPTPGPCFPSHCTCVSPITPSVPGAQARLPGHTQGMAHFLTLCLQAHIVPRLLAVPTGSSQRVVLGPVDTAGSWVFPGCTARQSPIWTCHRPRSHLLIKFPEL